MNSHPRRSGRDDTKCRKEGGVQAHRCAMPPRLYLRPSIDTPKENIYHLYEKEYLPFILAWRSCAALASFPRIALESRLLQTTIMLIYSLDTNSRSILGFQRRYNLARASMSLRGVPIRLTDIKLQLPVKPNNLANMLG